MSYPDPASYRIVGYGAQAWNRKARSIGRPFTEDEARARHDAGEAYDALLTAAPGDGVELPLAKLTVNEHGVSVSLHHHDTDRGDQAQIWKPGADGRLRPVQLDRRAGNKAVVPRDQLVYEFLKLTDEPAAWIRWDDGGSTRLEEREVDLDAVAVAWPAFGEYQPFLDAGLGQRLWPGLPELAWVGPDQPVAR